jgi:phosphoketolase
MGYLTQNHLDQAAEYWRNGQFLEAGKIIFENLPVAARPGWASRILELAIERTGTNPSYALPRQKQPWRWRQGRFSSRGSTTFQL